MTQQAMKAAIFRPDTHEAQIETVTLAELRDDEVLVRLVATGICHTDLTCRDGMMPLPRPIILGHEGAGVVEQTGGAVTDLQPGDKVVLTFLPCGACDSCAAGAPAYCHQFMPGNFSGRRLDGTTALQCDHADVAAHFFGQSSFATYSVANARNAIRVRDDAPLELLAPLGCGIQTGAGAVMNTLRPGPGDSILILGAGGVGLSAVMAARVEGCTTIIVVEPHTGRRALALELGATHVFDPAAETNLPDRVRTVAPQGVNHAFDTSGVPAVIGQAIDLLGPRGQIALVTANRIDAMLQAPLLSLPGRGITIRGVSMGDSVPHSFIPRLVDLVMDGRFPLEKLVRFYDFDAINQALADQEAGLAVKPILRMPQ